MNAMTRYNFYLNKEDMDKLQEIADRESEKGLRFVSLSELIRIAIRDIIKKFNKEK